MPTRLPFPCLPTGEGGYVLPGNTLESLRHKIPLRLRLEREEWRRAAKRSRVRVEIVERCPSRCCKWRQRWGYPRPGPLRRGTELHGGPPRRRGKGLGVGEPGEGRRARNEDEDVGDAKLGAAALGSRGRRQRWNWASGLGGHWRGGSLAPITTTRLFVWYIAKAYLEKPKQFIIWNGWSTGCFH